MPPRGVDVRYRRIDDGGLGGAPDLREVGEQRGEVEEPPVERLAPLPLDGVVCRAAFGGVRAAGGFALRPPCAGGGSGRRGGGGGGRRGRGAGCGRVGIGGRGGRGGGVDGRRRGGGARGGGGRGCVGGGGEGEGHGHLL